MCRTGPGLRISLRADSMPTSLLWTHEHNGVYLSVSCADRARTVDSTACQIHPSTTSWQLPAEPSVSAKGATQVPTAIFERAPMRRTRRRLRAQIKERRRCYRARALRLLRQARDGACPSRCKTCFGWLQFSWPWHLRIQSGHRIRCTRARTRRQTNQDGKPAPVAQRQRGADCFTQRE